MLFSLAWRNIWRNKRRSLIIISAITIGLLCGLFASAVMFGMSDSLLNSTIDRDLGHIQIHSKNYDKDKLLTDTLPGAMKIMSDIRRRNNVTGLSARTVIGGMGSSATSSSGVKIVGINPDEERSVTTIYKQIVRGQYLSNENQESQHLVNPIIIGQKLAENLGIKERSKIILSFQGFDGSIIYGAFRVTGIFRTESTTFDKMNVFVRQDDLFSLLGSAPVYHEVVVRLSSVKYVDSLYSALKAEYPGLSVESWKDLSPELKLMDEMTGLQLNIFLGVILFALLFGITNTMLMSVIERIREFGVLISIGMKRSRVFIMIILETVFLSLVGGVLGMTLASGIIAYFSQRGIDLSSLSQGFTQWNINPVLKPELPMYFYFSITLMIILTAVFSALYPALKAIKLKPAQAIRTY